MQRVLTVTWDDPAALGAEALRQPGAEFLRAIRDGVLPPAPIQELLGFSLDEVQDGRVVFGSTPGEQHYNPIGVVHAGLAATLLDSAMGAAVHSTLGRAEGYTTLETKFNLVRPITVATGRIVCEGRVVHQGNRVCTAEGRVTSASEGRLLAHGTSTCLVITYQT
jgi:uncharacterized protein (TIGR00369 family)